VLPRKSFKRTMDQVKELADGLGERRDRDVAIDALRGFSGQMPAVDRRGVETLVERLREEQADANELLAPLVAPQRLGEVRVGIEELISSIRHRETGAG
jgi:CHAD domain-containing protein